MITDAAVPEVLPSRSDADTLEGLTPPEDLFITSHFGTPFLNEQDFRSVVQNASKNSHLKGFRYDRFQIAGLVETPLSFSLETLKRFPMSFIEEEFHGVGRDRYRCDSEGHTATIRNPLPVGRVRWGGTLLGPLLRQAQISPRADYIAFCGQDGCGKGRPYEAALQVRDPTLDACLLAWEMNGVPLLPAHGAPLRLVVPGRPARESVKWVVRGELRAGTFHDPLREGLAGP
jgi:DMSO/TMAO reductase YedYZ molybdopterin-dependent catalytic subunit